jgi:hypothetical protein
VFRTIGDQCSLWESLLPEEVLRLPGELARVDALLDDPVFFAPFAPHFHPVIGRPSTPVECYDPGGGHNHRPDSRRHRPAPNRFQAVGPGSQTVLPPRPSGPSTIT